MLRSPCCLRQVPYWQEFGGPECQVQRPTLLLPHLEHWWKWGCIWITVYEATRVLAHPCFGGLSSSICLRSFKAKACNFDGPGSSPCGGLHGPLLFCLPGSDGSHGPPLTLGRVGGGPWSSQLPVCPGCRLSRGSGDGEGQESTSVGVCEDIPLAQPPTWEIWFWGQECDKTLRYAAGFLPSMWFAGKCGHKMLEIMNWMDSPSGEPYLSLQN